MASQEDSKPVNDGAILFANSTDQDDPFQALATGTAKPDGDSHTGPTKSSQASPEGNNVPIAKEPASSVTAKTQAAASVEVSDKAIAGDASMLFGDGNSNDNSAVEALFGGLSPTSDVLSPNQPLQQQQQQQQVQQGTDSLFGQAQPGGDPFFNGQYENGTYQGYADQKQQEQHGQQYENQRQEPYGGYYEYSQQYDQYGAQNDQQQQYSQYDSQQGQQQQQYDQYAAYANYQYQDSYNNSYQQADSNYYQHDPNTSYANYDPQQYGQYAGYQYGDQQSTGDQYTYDAQAMYLQQEGQSLTATQPEQYSYPYQQRGQTTEKQPDTSQYAYDSQIAYQPAYEQQAVNNQAAYESQTEYSSQLQTEESVQYTSHSQHPVHQQAGAQEQSPYGYTEQEIPADQAANQSQYAYTGEPVEHPEAKIKAAILPEAPEPADNQLIQEEQTNQVHDEQPAYLHVATEQGSSDPQNAKKEALTEQHVHMPHNEKTKEWAPEAAAEVVSGAVAPESKTSPLTTEALSTGYSFETQNQHASEEDTKSLQADGQIDTNEKHNHSYAPEKYRVEDLAAYQPEDYMQQQSSYHQGSYQPPDSSHTHEDKQVGIDANALQVEDLQNEQRLSSNQAQVVSYESATYQAENDVQGEQYQTGYQPEQSSYDPSAYQAVEDLQAGHQSQQSLYHGQQATYDSTAYKPVEDLQAKSYQPYQDQSAYDSNSYMGVENFQKQPEYGHQAEAVLQEHQDQYSQYSQYGYFGEYEQTDLSEVPQTQQGDEQIDPGFSQVSLQASSNESDEHGAARSLDKQSGDARAEDGSIPTLAQPYDPYAYSTPPIHAGAPPPMNKPDKATSHSPINEVIVRQQSPMELAGRGSMERSNTMYSTGSMLSRLASPALDQQLYPCPDPNCEGENKSKAKFCCECGRPISSISRAATPAVASVASATMPDTPASYDPMATYSPPAAQSFQQQQQEPYLPEQTYGHEPAILAVNDTGGDMGGYYGGDMAAAQDIYDPLAQQQQQQQQQQQEYPPDPLNRARGCPLISFGFGGKFCVMFPQTVQRFTNHAGYETGAPITKTMPSVVKIKKLKDVLGEEDPMILSLSQFVGPVLNDSRSSTKAKKKEASAYLDKRIAEMTEALGPATGTSEFSRTESRILLWRLVKTLLETDGPVNDTDKMDSAVRALLQPQITAIEDQGDFSVPAYAQSNDVARDEDAENIERSNKVLGKLQNYLIEGEREKAVDYAMQEDLWPHALILGSCTSKDVWKRVVSSFVDRELSAASDRPRQDRLNVHGDKQGLRVLYSLFAGSGAAAMNEFLQLSEPGQRMNTPFANSLPAQQRESDDQLKEWRVTLTLILANRTSRDTEAITALGDILRNHSWLDAAHICYLLSPKSSLHAGIDAPHVRLTLLGSETTTARSDLDSYFLTELFEFATSLKQGGPASLPFLQGYKLVHAWWLADLGYVSEAQRYCEAIASAIKGYTKGSPYLHRQLLESLREFGELCEATSGHGIGGDTGSWLKNKLSKNSLDSLWGSLEGKFNKFVSGDDIRTEEPPPRKSTEIMANPYDIATDGPPARSASAFDFRIGRASVGPEGLRRAATPTASMASEGYGNRRSSSPGARITGTFTHAFTPLSNDVTETTANGTLAPASAAGEVSVDQNPAPAPTYGGSAYGGYGYGSRPTNATMSPFGQPETSSPYAPTQGYNSQFNEQQENSYGDSWYGSQQPQYEPTSMQQYEPSSGYEPVSGASQYEHASAAAPAAPRGYFNDDNDLGLGNPRINQETIDEASGAPTPGAAVESETQIPEKTQGEESKKENTHDDKKADEAKGWRIFSLFHRSSSSTPVSEKKAVKANLGETSTFYYDEKEKRWVNKTVPSQPAAPSLPPPPKATPKPSTPAPPPGGAAQSQPPPATSINPSIESVSSSSMMAGPPGPRSGTSTPPPTAPPSAGGRRSGSRKPMRSRYVDVFNQPGN